MTWYKMYSFSLAHSKPTCTEANFLLRMLKNKNNDININGDFRKKLPKGRFKIIMQQMT